MPDLTAGRDCEVVSRCGWGCASANLEVDPKAHAAKWDPAESPFGRSDWIPFTARGSDTAGQDVEVTLHVCAGYLQELEIWTGEYGDFSIPEPETLRFGVELASTKLGSIKITSRDSEPGEAHGFGGLETTAERLLDSVEWRLSESLGTDWLPCRPGRRPAGGTVPGGGGAQR